ncbi:MAG: protecting protein DprA protein [Candidatus Moranbacteria bacterium GW2011_GWE1_35_17]|nr:MAG: protecting protein DprA protein [Candidatus Moranbacteria bacterium GW2011_GWE1_35_17]KKP82586.1 MAG: protecting protein DprA protein [Candidatus Moranbacteria bacterium GW2011_GWF1_35_5]KKP84805.1 MAG: protecting protein DprA protein [Candidatus Moranbacteria bacterium GW2011_GWF2_35_54]
MIYLNALNKINRVGPQKIKILMSYFGSGEKIWNSSPSELISSGLSEKLSQIIVTERIKINPQEEWAKLEKENIQAISFFDKNYPASLKEIPSAPQILYVKGDFDFNSSPMIAIVGSRKYSSYGQQVATSLAQDLAKAGLTVVSGLAIGIDAFAHRGALDGGGKTLAVLGSSLEDRNIGPRVNYNLARHIIDNGALISDYPLGVQATPQTFPARNRLMAGLTLGTVVIEAAPASGTLITASMALDFNREVFAVPGSIFSPSSQGTNQLIKSGAKIVSGVTDILEELNLAKFQEKKTAREFIPASEEEKIIIKMLSHEPTHIDRIIKLSKMNTSSASSTLIMLEMQGIVKDIGGQNYISL